MQRTTVTIRRIRLIFTCTYRINRLWSVYVIPYVGTLCMYCFVKYINPQINGHKLTRVSRLCQVKNLFDRQKRLSINDLAIVSTAESGVQQRLFVTYCDQQLKSIRTYSVVEHNDRSHDDGHLIIHEVGKQG